MYFHYSKVPTLIVPGVLKNSVGHFEKFQAKFLGEVNDHIDDTVGSKETAVSYIPKVRAEAHNLVTKQMTSYCKEIPDLKQWTKPITTKVSRHDLPSLGIIPSEYITEIGDFLKILKKSNYSITTAINLLVKSYFKIPVISDMGIVQLKCDMDYICDVADSLGIENVEELLKSVLDAFVVI